MPRDLPSLPCPPLTIRVDVPADLSADVDVSALPAKPGVFVIEESGGGALALATTANLRRMITSRLQVLDAKAGPTRRVNYRAVARTILAVPVGSSFEADWAYLQLARQRMPHTYRSLLDRWQVFFAQCDPEADFPEFVKTAHPDPSSSSTTVYLGPIADKHAAGRFIDALVDAFDLCRYRHILVQAPHGAACAYKEMGRCPAPCDGSISMDQYRANIRQAIEFACTSADAWQMRMEASIQQASAALEFESAARLRNVLIRTAATRKPQFARVDDLRRFAFLAVMPSVRRRWARLFLILGGWIEPIADIAADSVDAVLLEVLETIANRAHQKACDFSREGIENIGMACAHLLRPRGDKTIGSFLRISDDLDFDSLRRAIRKLDKSKPEADVPLVVDQGLESTDVQ